EDEVRPEPHVVDPHDAGAVLDMLHDGVERMTRMLSSDRRMRRRLDAADATGRGDLLQQLVRLQLRLVEQRASAGMRKEHRLGRGLARLERRDVPRMRAVDRHAELIHPSYGLAAEHR